MKNKIFGTLLILLLTESAAISAPINDVIVKFSITMIGVVISIVSIFIGLTIYNKIRNNLGLNTEDEILKAPKTKDDAIKFFIRKNKIQ